MGFYIKYEDIRDLIKLSTTQFGKWQGQLKRIQRKIQGVIDWSEFQGKTAENIKNYLSEVNYLQIYAIVNVMQNFQAKTLLYQNWYYNNIDYDENTKICEETLDTAKSSFVKSRADFYTEAEILNSKMKEVEDIFFMSSPSTYLIFDDYDNVDNKITNLKEDINEYEQSTLDSELNDLSNLIYSLKATINEYKNKDRKFLPTYTIGDYKKSANFEEIAIQINISEKYTEEHTVEIGLAAKNEMRVQEIFRKEAEEKAEEALAKQREEQGKWGIIGGIAFAVIGTICIVGSLGMATPAVAVVFCFVGEGTVAFGVADMVSGGQDIYYGSNGDITSGTLNDGIIDNVFGGNEAAYGFTKNAFAFAASAFIPIGGLAKAGTLTLRSTTTIIGKEVAGEITGFSANYLGEKVGLNPTQCVILSMGTSMFTAKGLDIADTKFNMSGIYTKASAFGVMSVEDAKRYNSFMDNGSQLDFTNAEKFGFSKLDEQLALNKIDYNEIQKLRVLEAEKASTVIKGVRYSETEINDIINNLKGDGFKNNPLRQAYENEVFGLKVYGEELLSSGMTEEKVAQTLNLARRDLGVKYKNATPQPLRDYIYEINSGRYGDELGPTYDYMIGKGKSNIDIINSSSNPNSNIDSLFSGFEEWLRRQ